MLSPLEQLPGREAGSGCFDPTTLSRLSVKSRLRVPTIAYLQWNYLESVDVSSVIYCVGNLSSLPC